MSGHKMEMDRTRLEILGWECPWRYQPRCSCGWIGDETKSMTQACMQAEWHTGRKLNAPTGWAAR